MLNVALLGSGFMGSTHAAGWRSLAGRARVVSVCSRTPEAAAELAASLGAEALGDLEAAIADPRVDAVDVCLPTPLHRHAAELAFAAGKHVLLEKPIALEVDDARAILEAAERSGRLLLVALVVRFWPEYAELQRLVAAGELGTLRAVTASRLSARPDWAAWLTDEAQSGGVVVDLMSHDLDQLNWLLGTPRRVTALARARDHVQALVEYDDAAGVVEGSWAMPRSYPFSAAIRVLGDEGAAEYSFSSAPVEGGNVGAPAASSGLRLFPRDGAATSVPVEAGDPWALQLASFVDCVERGVAPEQGTGAQALLALETALAVRRSLDLGASVALR